MTDHDRERHKLNYTHEGYFDENSPRPPVPGEEQAHCTSDWPLQNKAIPPTPRKYYYTNDLYAPMGYEPEGRSKSRNTPSPPACLRWSCSLHQLLEDSDGVELFRRYLQAEGRPHADALDFWFACEGLRKQKEPDRVQQLVKAIYKRFFHKFALPIPEEVRKDVGRCVKSSSNLCPPVTIFDDAQTQVERLISSTTYPNFLNSNMYLGYIQSVQNPNVTSGELSSDSSSSSSAGSARDLSNLASGVGLPTLHEDMEFVTGNSSTFGYTPGAACINTGYHTPNTTGSGVRLTKDMLLVTQKRRALDVRPKPEAYAGDSKSLCRPARRHSSLLTKQVQELAALNKETNMHQTIIPRTQRLDSRQYHGTDPATFAPILIEKLERVKREQDSKEILKRKLKEDDILATLDNVQSAELANAIREKLQLEDDNVQDILDQHVSRVFSDLTPTLSPGFVSPSRNRWPVARRKDKDGFSTFSSDSGNIHDYPEMIKSKSMTDYTDERDKFVRGASGRRSSSRKTLTDLTDSGVSVVSDTPPVVHNVKDNRVLAWVMESDRSGRSSGHTHSELSGKHSRHRKAYSGSRSSSIERSSATGSLNFGPAQPFVADPSMPPLPIPNTAIQLEEVRRRLEERFRTKSNKHVSDLCQSTQSTLRKSTRNKGLAPQTSNIEAITTVVFSFCDEQFPYRVKIPGNQITLKQFKEYLPKKGNYRYFFKTECEELDNQVIQEEVSNDLDIVPLFEGKIMAQVKPID